MLTLTLTTAHFSAQRPGEYQGYMPLSVECPCCQIGRSPGSLLQGSGQWRGCGLPSASPCVRQVHFWWGQQCSHSGRLPRLVLRFPPLQWPVLPQGCKMPVPPCHVCSPSLILKTRRPSCLSPRTVRGFGTDPLLPHLPAATASTFCVPGKAQLLTWEPLPSP